MLAVALVIPAIAIPIPVCLAFRIMLPADQSLLLTTEITQARSSCVLLCLAPALG